MKATFHILFSLIALMALGVQPFHKVSAQQRDDLRFRGAINVDGWELPGLRGSRFVSRRVVVLSENASTGKLFFSILRPKSGSVILEQRAHYFPQKDGTLLVQVVAIQTRSIGRYDVEGKPFCYVYFGGGARIIVTADGRKHFVALGCSGGSAYYDEDGDGVFERVDSLGGTVGFKPRIPEWVRQYVPAPPQHNKALQLTAR